MSRLFKRRDYVCTFHNPELHGFLTPESFLEQCKNVENLRYLCFQWEITPSAKDEFGNVVDVKETDGTKSINHYQMYFEFTKNTSHKFIWNNLFKGRKVYFDDRLGTQEEAINYCSNKGKYSDPKESKDLVVNKFFEYGTPKKSYHLTNPENMDIPHSREEQLVYIDDNIAEKKYNSYEDIKKDFHYRSIVDKKLLREMIRDNNPVNTFDLVPADVIWIYGKSGSGKSCYTDQLLESKGYTPFDTAFLKSDRATPMWFELDDEDKKVLVIEEVRREWPNHHSLINLIDRKGNLPVKGSQIRNNFELIVINSLLSPEDVYNHLPDDKIIEPLRRIYNGKVLRIERNNDLYIDLINKFRNGEIDKRTFKFGLVPIVHDETDNNIPKALREHMCL